MRRMQGGAPVEPERSTMASPSWTGTWRIPVAARAAPAGEPGWQWLSGLAAAAHPAEGGGRWCHERMSAGAALSLFASC